MTEEELRYLQAISATINRSEETVRTSLGTWKQKQIIRFQALGKVTRVTPGCRASTQQEEIFLRKKITVGAYSDSVALTIGTVSSDRPMPK